MTLGSWFSAALPPGLGDEAADMVVGDVCKPRPHWLWVTAFREENLDQKRALKSLGVGLLEALLSDQAKPDLGTLVEAASAGAKDYFAPKIGPWLRQFDDWDELGGARAAIAATRKAVSQAEDPRLREGQLQAVLEALDTWPLRLPGGLFSEEESHRNTPKPRAAILSAWSELE